MPAQTFAIRLCNWDEARLEARRIRELVFVREQGVPLELEWDVEISGPEFMGAGIPHVPMQRDLATAPG